MVAPPATQRERPPESESAQLIEPEQHFGEASEPIQEIEPLANVEAPAVPPPPVQSAMPDDHRPEVPGLVPPIFGFGRSNGRIEERDKPRRSKAGEALEEDSPWVPAAPVAPDHHDRNGEEMTDGFDDRVPVVRPSDDDFDSWDSEMLPWGGGDDPGGEVGEGEEAGEVDDAPVQQESVDDPAEWGTLGWEGEQVQDTAGPDADVPVSPAYAAWRPSRVDAEAHAAARAQERPIMSGGPDLTEEEIAQLWAEREAEDRERELARRRALGLLTQEEQEAEEAEKKDERQAVNLLHQDDGAWGGNAADTGVIG
jgi:hypothetical protein